MFALPLSLALAVSAASTTIGPELVERFTESDVSVFAAGAGDVVVVKGQRLTRHALDGTVREDEQLGCTPVDVVAVERAWAVLCGERLVMQGERFGTAAARFTVDLAPQSSRPVLLAVEPFHRVWVVAYEDGLVQRGHLEEGSAVAAEEIDLRAKPLSIVVSNIKEVAIALDDGTQHVWTLGGRVQERGASAASSTSSTSSTLVELYVDAEGTKRARVSHNVASGSATTMYTKRGPVALSSSTSSSSSSSSSSLGTVDALDVSVHDVVCARTGAMLRCYGREPPPPPAIPPRAADTDAPEVMHDDVVSGDEFEAPLDFGTPGALAAIAGTVLGTGAFASAPFALQALSPSLGIGSAFALAGLGAVAGLSAFAAVASVVFVVGAIVVAAMRDDTPSAGGACAPGINILEDAVEDCICAVASMVAIVGAVGATVSVGVALLATAAMPHVDIALGGGAPASDPLLPALGGAAAGSVVGFGLGLGVSLLTAPLRDTDGDEEPDDDLAVLLDSVQTTAFVVGGSALGASIGYGVARGP